MNRLIDMLGELEDPSYDQINFFLMALKKFPDQVVIPRLSHMVKSSRKFAQELVRNEKLLRQFVQALLGLQEKQGIRMHQVFSMVLKIESFGIRPDCFKTLLSKTYAKQKKILEKEVIKDVQFINYMYKYNVLSSQNALAILKELKEMADIHFKAKMVSLSLQGKDLSEQQVAELKEQAKEVVKGLQERMNSDKLAVKLMSIPSLLRMPAELLAEAMPTMESVLRSNVATINEKIYYQAVCAIQPSFYAKSRDTYSNILRELLIQYPNQNKRLCFAEVLEVMDHFAKLHVHNTQLFNNFLNDVANYFNMMQPEARVKAMSVFAHFKLKQSDFLAKNLEKISEAPLNYRNHFNDLVDVLFRLGYNEQRSFEQIQAIAAKFDHFNLGETLSLLCFYSLFPYEKVRDHITKLVEAVQPENR